MLKAVAFDVDSTLVDFLRFKRIATESAALAMVDAGLDMAPSLAEQRLWETYRTAGLDGDVAFEAFLRSTLGHVEPHLLAAAIHAYQRSKETHLEPYPGVLPTLIQLVRRDLRLAIITDAERPKALHRLRAMRLLPFFETVITLDDTLFGKADEQPYHMLLARLGAAPHEVLMVGDNPARDVRPARRAGLWTAFAAYGAQPHFLTKLEGDEPHFALQRIDDLVPVVDRLRMPTALPAAKVADAALA
jgi:HAD superfamily hydrolase (TIGR01549 family)